MIDALPRKYYTFAVMIPTRKELQLQSFAEAVLSILEDHKEWTADTADEIAGLAMEMGLAKTNEDKEFVAKKEFTS